MHSQGSGSRKASSNGKMNDPFNIAAIMQTVPFDSLDLVHYIIGHGILRKELRYYHLLLIPAVYHLPCVT